MSFEFPLDAQCTENGKKCNLKSTKTHFLPFLKMQIMLFLHFWNCTFFPILEHCEMAEEEEEEE